MANICEKAISLWEGNLNSAVSYLITTVRLQIILGCSSQLLSGVFPYKKKTACSKQCISLHGDKCQTDFSETLHIDRNRTS